MSSEHLSFHHHIGILRPILGVSLLCINTRQYFVFEPLAILYTHSYRYVEKLHNILFYYPRLMCRAHENGAVFCRVAISLHSRERVRKLYYHYVERRSIIIIIYTIPSGSKKLDFDVFRRRKKKNNNKRYAKRARRWCKAWKKKIK